MIAPVRQTTAAEAATEALFEAICDGTIAPGEHLRLQDLANQLGLSMMPVREAIRRLEAMELVDLEPHRGARVRPLTLADLRDTYTTRIVLEGLAVRSGAARFTVACEQVARHALDERAEHLAAGRWKAARDAHERFHFALYDSSGNPWLRRSILPLWRNAERYRLESFRHPEVAEQRALEHEAMLSAMVAGDADRAEATLVTHLTASMEIVIANLPRTGELAAV